MAETITPRGADQPLPPLPAEVPITAGDKAAALRLWDELMPRDVRGLLGARVVNAGAG